MEYYLNKEKKFEKWLKAAQILYIIGAVVVFSMGIYGKSPYTYINGACTLFVFLILYLARRIFHVEAGVQLETYIYIFSFLGWTLGGAASVYNLLPGFDKVVHTLSGVFVSSLALAAFYMMERGRDKNNKVLKYCFVFFTSVAIAGLFEICEFSLAPVMQRDLQHVLDTGVTDTMMDIIVCTVGTVISLFIMHRSDKGKHDFITDAAMGFVCKNPLKEKAAEK